MTRESRDKTPKRSVKDKLIWIAFEIQRNILLMQISCTSGNGKKKDRSFDRPFGVAFLRSET